MDLKNDLFKEICTERRGVDTRVLKQTVTLAVEIAREGREGRKIGTLFVVGDSEAGAEDFRAPSSSTPYKATPKRPSTSPSPNVRETLKELAQLDGAFLVSDEGVVLSAARYIDAISDNLELPLGARGAGTWPGASVSQRTNAVFGRSLGELDGAGLRRRTTRLGDNARALDARPLRSSYLEGLPSTTRRGNEQVQVGEPHRMSKPDEVLEVCGREGEDGYGEFREAWFTEGRGVRPRGSGTASKASTGRPPQASWRAGKTKRESCLALVILLDQFPRNMFRGDPRDVRDGRDGARVRPGTPWSTPTTGSCRPPRTPVLVPALRAQRGVGRINASRWSSSGGSRRIWDLRTCSATQCSTRRSSSGSGGSRTATRSWGEPQPRRRLSSSGARTRLSDAGVPYRILERARRGDGRWRTSASPRVTKGSSGPASPKLLVRLLRGPGTWLAPLSVPAWPSSTAP